MTKFYPLGMAPFYAESVGAWYVTTMNPGPIEVVIKVEGEEADAKRYAARVVAAFNACAGIPTEALEALAGDPREDSDLAQILKEARSLFKAE